VNHIPGEYGMQLLSPIPIFATKSDIVAGALGIYYLLTHMYSMGFKLGNSLLHYIWSSLILSVSL
jgi:hypothetical protein